MLRDPFADVLFGVATDLGGVACSLDAANAQDIIVVNDLEESPVPGTDVGASKAVATKKKNIAAQENIRKRKRPPAASKTPVRRKYDAEKHLVLTALPENDGANIKTVFVPTHQKQKNTASTDASFALALWPQFDAAWRGANFGDRTWLVLSSQSPWFSKMIRTAIPKAKRDAVAGVFGLAKDEFTVSLSRRRIQDHDNNVKRATGDINTLLDVSDDDGSASCDDGDESSTPCREDGNQMKTQSFRLSEDTPPLVQVTIGVHKVTCVNSMRQIVLCVNDDTVGFIRHWLLPLALNYATDVRPIMKMVRSQSQSTLEQQDSQTSEECKAKTVRPTFQNKIIWSPSKMAWLVKAKQVAKNTNHIKEFPVDTALRGTDFRQMKASQFRLAVAEWNKCDGSKSARIELAEGFGETDAPAMQTLIGESDQSDNNGTESGSQPSPIAHRWDMDDGL